jgi:cation diffusion facilitator CzcD-associated flavoprotein CzcO
MNDDAGNPTAGLARHDQAVARDLTLLGLPPENWTNPRAGPDGRTMADVVIVGAGMCGLAAAAALILRGVRHIQVLDRAPAGQEGPWMTFARMLTLRSTKHLTGPAMGIPSLTFRAWYEARYSESDWEALDRITNGDWMDYLVWLRRVLALPVRNDITVTRLDPQADWVALHTDAPGADAVLFTRHVVLATGMGGADQFYLPALVDRALWPDLAAHAAEPIDIARLAGRRVAVLGGGPSAWDNAAAVLEAGAAQTDMFIRRPTLPQINKGRGTAYPGFIIGYAGLPDADRWRLLCYLQDWPAPPPRDTILRALPQRGLHLHFGTVVTRATRQADKVALTLADGTTHTADFLIAATGFQTDLTRVPVLSHLAPLIATWRDRYQPPRALDRPELAAHPYLGPGFEFIEREPGCCPGLERISFFNHGAAASHGPLAGGIPGVSTAAERLAGALVAALLRADAEHMHARLAAFDEAELAGTPFYLGPADGF